MKGWVVGGLVSVLSVLLLSRLAVFPSLLCVLTVIFLIFYTLVSNFCGPVNNDIAFLRPSAHFELHQFESLDIFSFTFCILH